MNKVRFSVVRALAMARKETIHIQRDPRSLALAFLLPLVLFTLFGYALSFDVDRVPLVVLDRDQTPESRKVIEAFNGSPYFSLVGAVDTGKELNQILDRRDALIGLTIQPGFAADRLSGVPARAQLLADGSDSLTAQLAIGYAHAIAAGLNAAVSGADSGIVDARFRILYNPELKSRIFTVSGLVALIMIIIGAVLTSLTIAREWERGTMEQIIATRVTPGEILLGKFLPYFVIGLLDLALGIAMAVLVFNVPLHGSLALLMVLSALFLAVALGQGLLISTISRNQLLANQMALLTSFLPAFLLSGFFAPIDNMPAAIRAITYFVPARYAMTICRGIMLKGVGLSILWPDVLALGAFAAVLFLLAREKFVRRIG
ncbi:MAG: ABC transporter permease [Pseudomonadota bacterium]